jgi:hypothetical protein
VMCPLIYCYILQAGAQLAARSCGLYVHADPSSSAGTVQCSAMLAPTVPSAVLRVRLRRGSG